MYAGTRLAALAALDAGITTMPDFSHNSRTSAHSDAAIRALADPGIRGCTPPWARTSAPGTTSGPLTWNACATPTAKAATVQVAVIDIWLRGLATTPS
ncbi:hypothetical protein [Streptomonospora salina]|uniref:Cytosine/adenosine deaminase-related metal-dependent hydrolase n=1 Tax=Streptomonospora salina TaxID=104205 RepID=A0A841EHQ7_9ACTN|nr:hypothetical protein [Streptomonospora salina]MBB6000909.1 cytosine/adenosine deaminase-related metal-dependent hydrolase [Streptomonospora salina]